MKKRLLIVFVFVLIGISLKVQAYDFSLVSNGNVLYFNITSATAPYKVEVTSQTTSRPYYYSAKPTGIVIIPNSVTYNEITYSVTSIGNFAFYGCTSITSVTIPNSVTSIESVVFTNCTNLTSVIIPNSVTSIGNYIFDGCSSLTSITIPNSITSLGSGTFYSCTSLTSITLPNSITSIGDHTFYRCTSLASITIPNSVTSIEDQAFGYCSSLTSITIPNAVTSIGYDVFGFCTALTSVSIPNSVTSIDQYAFEFCSSLISVTIPNSVTSIGETAFQNCSGLTSITFLGLPPSISTTTFTNVSTNIPVYVYCNLSLIYLATPNFNFTNIIEMPCPALTDTTEYVEIKGISSNTNLTIQGGSGIKWVKKGNESPVFYSGTVVNINSSSNEIIKIYGDFTSLKCNNNSLNNIDISNSRSLENLDCSSNLFDSLAINSSILKTLSCGGNQLKYLNLSNCNALEMLETTSSNIGQLNNVNLNGCNALKEADFTSQMNLEILDISNLPSFTTLKCDNTSLATIIANNTPNFDTIYCKLIASSCTYDSLFTSLPTKDSGSFGRVYFGESLTTEESTCRDSIALRKGWIPYTMTPTGNVLAKTPNTTYSCFIVSVLTDENDNSYGYVTGSGSYEEGDIVVLNAIPYENNTFLYWNDGNTNATRTISAHDTTFTAIFRHFNLVYDTVYICEGETYQFFNSNLVNAGDYTYDDSITTTLYERHNLNLKVRPISYTSITASICQGEIYTENEFNENSTGVFIDNLQSINGCDSIITLNLIVNPIYNDTIIANICQNQTYNLNGFNESTEGFYTQNLQTVNGCDSIVNLSLIVNPTYLISHNDVICQGELYSNYGFSFIADTTGLYMQNLQTLKGCDSIIILNLIVNPIYNHTIEACICEGTTYSLNGFNENTEGTYSQELQTINGCDSVVNLNLIVNPVFNDTIIASICQDETYNQFGFNENTTGFYTQNMQTINGCDSIVNLSLTFNPSFNDTITAEICQGEVYNQFGFNENTTGFYTQNMQTINGCDSLLILNLIVNEVTTPTNLTLDNVENYFKLSWYGDSERYVIYKDNDSICVITTRIFNDTNVVNGITYCYQVKALVGECESEKVEICNIFTGLDDKINKDDISIILYPNPTSGKAILEVEGITIAFDVFIYDITGRYLKTYKLEANQKELDIDLTGFAKGVYQVKVLNNTKKLIVN
ncbi:MAG: leucine-rich repeat protein [Bacteroidales bacterium]|nr:leucine-rich repeat protein [Bacteroidales bacterium]